MDSKFSSILDKFKQGANSMEEVYKELEYLTSTYDEELEKLQKQITELTIRSQNEEEKRHEAEANLADLKKLQQINFSTIIDELIRKPRESMENELKKSTRKFLSTAIITTIISIAIVTGIAFFSIYYKQEIMPLVKNDTSSEYKNLLVAMKSLEKKNQEYLDELKKIKSTINKQEKETIKKNEKDETQDKKLEKNELINKNEKNFNKQQISTDDKEKVLENISLHIKDFDSQYKLNNKNATRLLYKMVLLDFAPLSHKSIIQEIEFFAKNNTYVPSKSDLEVWDNQMLDIYKKMLNKIEDLPERKISESMMVFENYKVNDATKYGNWQYTGQEGMSIKESIKKEINRLEKQIELNN